MLTLHADCYENKVMHQDYNIIHRGLKIKTLSEQFRENGRLRLPIYFIWYTALFGGLE